MTAEQRAEEAQATIDGIRKRFVDDPEEEERHRQAMPDTAELPVLPVRKLPKEEREARAAGVVVGLAVILALGAAAFFSLGEGQAKGPKEPGKAVIIDVRKLK